jgi:site-specific DNA-methyltransferase (adenine-specific)/adenine-specific DNA-methyltransferase
VVGAGLGSAIFLQDNQTQTLAPIPALDLITAQHTYERPGRYTIAVKVIDIFGNDTMTLVPVNVG